ALGRRRTVGRQRKRNGGGLIGAERASEPLDPVALCLDNQVVAAGNEFRRVRERGGGIGIRNRARAGLKLANDYPGVMNGRITFIRGNCLEGDCRVVGLNRRIKVWCWRIYSNGINAHPALRESTPDFHLVRAA